MKKLKNEGERSEYNKDDNISLTFLFICISPLIYSYIYECGPEWISRDGYFILKLTILFVDIFCFLVALTI
uniref:Uncharacterized protein n=1 Tax=viral metagenome TaxID=1070528 RepID=A0A6M3KX32_9ZZZZ